MKICFLARPSFDVYSAELFNRIKEKDPLTEGVFITTNEQETNSVRSRIKDKTSVQIFETSAFLREHWNEFGVNSLIAFEQKYECAPIWEYIYTDRFLINYDYEYVTKVASGLFAFFEYVFQHTKPIFYYSECIATLQCYVAYIVGQKTNVIYLTQMCARGNLDSTYHYFVMTPYQYNCELNSDYMNTDFSEDELKKADEYLREFENKDSPPPAMKAVKTKPRIDKNLIVSTLKYFKHRFDPNLNDPYSYMYYRGYKHYLNPIIFYIRYHRMRKYFTKPDYNRKYIYYPLHYQPEGSTCVCAEKYEKQLYYIDSFAKSLPADTVLYVKEHYALLGHKELGFYKSLQKYPNVFLIDPWENSRNMMQGAVAVTTLTGTAGLEAMLLRKPVIIGGNAVYEDAPGVIKVKDIYEGYLPAITAWKEPEREDVIKYLCACFRTYRKGNIYCQNRHELLDNNIDDISDALYSKMMELA